jgi:hypothetical protein
VIAVEQNRALEDVLSCLSFGKWLLDSASVESEANTPGSAERAASSSEETKVDDDEKMIDNVY